MLKQNEWYFVPNKNRTNQLFKRDFLGYLNKVVAIKDNPNYCIIEQWLVTNDRQYEAIGVIEDADSVDLIKYGKKVNPPSKMFQILNSETVNGVKEKMTDVNNFDSEDEYNE